MIPVNEPLLNGKEKEYLCKCIDTGWISSEGPFVKQFENDFALRMARQFGISVCNGTAALEVAVLALGLEPGDEVIMPAFTIISCASAIVRAGLVPVLVDADPVTWNMDVNQVLSVITPRTKAVMAVHIYGLPVDMDPLLTIAKENNLYVIEDAAEAHGLDYKGKPCGSFGDISIFSFYPNKHITTGEGGMILTNDTALAQKCMSLRNLCFQPERRFVHEELGWNMRMSNLQAAVGVAQLERLNFFLEKKRSMGRLYTELLNDIQGIQLPLASTDYAENCYWVYGIVLKDETKLKAVDVMKALGEKKIGTRPFFYPMNKQPVLKKLGLFEGCDMPIAENLSQMGFYVPGGLALTESQIHEVAQALKEILV